MSNEDPSVSKDRSAEMAASKAAAMEAYEKLLDAQMHFRQAAEAAGMEMKDSTIRQLLKGREKAEEFGGEAREYVREKPLASMGVAFLIGYIFAQVFSRK